MSSIFLVTVIWFTNCLIHSFLSLSHFAFHAIFLRCLIFFLYSIPPFCLFCITQHIHTSMLALPFHYESSILLLHLLLSFHISSSLLHNKYLYFYQFLVAISGSIFSSSNLRVLLLHQVSAVFIVLSLLFTCQY